MLTRIGVIKSSSIVATSPNFNDIQLMPIRSSRIQRTKALRLSCLAMKSASAYLLCSEAF